jgi:uncharacterized cupin superfamily protein
MQPPRHVLPLTAPLTHSPVEPVVQQDQDQEKEQEKEQEGQQSLTTVVPVVSSEMLSVGISEGGLVVARGLLQCTTGKYSDVVDDHEFFTVISGRASVEVTSVTGVVSVLELVEGTVGELRKGSEVIYTVYETLLKSFQLTMSESDEESDATATSSAGVSENVIQSDHEFASSSYAVLSSTVPLQTEEMEEGLSWASSDPAPVVTSTLLSTMDGGKLMRGLWRCEAGSCTYVEQDELFTVLQGRATVTVKSKSKKSKEGKEREERTLTLCKGMIGEFKAGDVATFVVEGEEAFLKSFQITGVESPAGKK